MTRRFVLRKRLDLLKKKDRRLIVGIETGRAPGSLGAAVVEVSGSGNDTVLSLLGFTGRGISPELQAALGALERSERFGSKELAGINFLVLHNLTKLYDDVLREADAAGDEIDVIGLECLEVGEFVFPADPGVLSEMTGRMVATRFRVGMADEEGKLVSVDEPLLQGIVSEMIDRAGLDEEARGAVTVALLANESIFSAGAWTCSAPGEGDPAAKAARKKGAAKEPGAPGAEGRASLCAEFFFPA